MTRTGGVPARCLALAFTAIAVPAVYAAPPVLDPVGNPFALPEFNIPANVTITATDADPGDA